MLKWVSILGILTVVILFQLYSPFNQMSEPTKVLKPCNEWPILTDSEMETFLSTIPNWLKMDDNGVPKLHLKFSTTNFVEALKFIQETGNIAERQGHHPDLHLTGWNNVEVIIYTHSLGGMTENDIILARCISNEIKPSYSKKFLKENPHIVI